MGPRGRGGRWLGAVLGGLALLATAVGCGGGSGRAGEVDVAGDRRQPSSLAGDWPTTTTTTTTTTTSPSPPAGPGGVGDGGDAAAGPPAPDDVEVEGGPASPSDMDESAGLTVSEPWPHPWPTSFEVGDAVVDRVPLFSRPGVQVPDGRSLPNPTFEGVPLVFLVRENQGDWLKVQIQSRPNGATAWIRSSDVSLRTVNHHIVVERGAKRLSLYHGEQLVLSAPVATGEASSPTPTGAFYVDYHGHPETDSGPYGALQLSATGYSEVYRSFGGGVGQIALHGTNQPGLIGTPASNGCVRMVNDVVLRVGDLAPTGTPVSIYA